MQEIRARWLTLAGLAWAAALAATIVGFAAAVLAGLGHDVSMFLVPGVLGYSWMGWVLLARRPGHPMGPLLCLIGLTDAIGVVVFAYARYTLIHAPGALPFGTAALWANTWLYLVPTSLGGFLLPMLFPEGRLLSPRWRPALWAALAFIPLSVAGNAFIPQTMSGYFPRLHDPYTYAPADRLFLALQGLAITCGAAAAVAAAASVVLRWRRADRTGRQQLKWFFAVLPLTTGSVIAAFIAPGSAVDVGLGTLSGTLTPVAIGGRNSRHLRLFHGLGQGWVFTRARPSP